MSVYLDTDSRAEAKQARNEADAAAHRARLIRDRCRTLLEADFGSRGGAEDAEVPGPAVRLEAGFR